MKRKPNKSTLLGKVRECGKTFLPLEDMCKLLGLPLLDFGADGKLQEAYRLAQIETIQKLRLAVLEQAIGKHDVRMAKLFIEHFLSPVLPDPDDQKLLEETANDGQD